MVKPPPPAPSQDLENTASPPPVAQAAAPPAPAPVALPPKIGISTQPLRRPTEKITIEIPGYLATALRHEGVERRTTARTLIMMGLKALGFEVHEQDLVPDGRRARSKRGA